MLFKFTAILLFVLGIFVGVATSWLLSKWVPLIWVFIIASGLAIVVGGLYFILWYSLKDMTF